VILSVVSGVVGGAAITLGGASLTAGVAAGFVLAALVIGGVVVPPLFRTVAARVRTSGALLVLGLALALGMAYLAESAGSATIIGAFAAGLVLHPTPCSSPAWARRSTCGRWPTRARSPWAACCSWPR
jgi:Kef-type K+ transport system membrane component KefB